MSSMSEKGAMDARAQDRPSFIQSLFKGWRQPDLPTKLPKLRGSMSAIAEFLLIPYLGPRATIQKMVQIAGPSNGVDAYYCSIPSGPGSGEKVEVYNAEGEAIKVKKESLTVDDFKIVACTGSDMFAKPPPADLADSVNAALRDAEPAAKDRHIAVSVLYFGGEKTGVFVLRGPADMSDEEVLDLRSSADAWTAVLAGRLERVRQKALLSENQQVAQLYAAGTKMALKSSIKGLVAICQGPVKNTLDVETITIWFIDEAHNEIWAPPKPALPDGLILPFGVGLVGHVASRARETGDFQKSILCSNNPQSCPVWGGDPDPNFVTRCLLSVPILAVHGGHPVGILQLVNKKSQGELEDDIAFSEADIRLAEVCAGIIADEIDRLLVDQIATKADMDAVKSSKGQGEGAGKRGSGAAFLSEYYEVNETQLVKKRNAGSASEDEIIRTISNVGQHGVDINSWNVDYWNLSEAQQFQVVLRTLLTCRAPVSDQHTLGRFFGKVRAGYRDNPYHNFHHAIATVHYSYKLMRQSGMDKHLGESDVFALLVGSLCHDLDHRGFNTQYEVITRSELAIRYNDSSPLENHHCARTFEIAFAGGENGDCNVFQGMNADFYTAMRKTMVAGILGTDMKVHGDHVKKAQKFDPNAEADAEQALFLVELFMHTADIANPFMPPDVSKRWANVLAEEFTLQVESERRLGLPVTPFMDGLTTPVARAKSGLGFTDFVVFPLVDPLFKVFEGWADPKGWLVENRKIAADVIQADKDAQGAAAS